MNVACRASTQSRATRPGRPVEIGWASGTREVCADMRQILSWPMGQHGALLGYPSLFNPYTRELVEKLTGWMNRGVASVGAYPPECEERLAETLVKRYQNYMTSSLKVRFAQNGTDVTQAAVALARYATGRDKIVSIGYHGGSSPTFNFPPQNGGSIKANYEAVIEIGFEEFLLTPIDVSDCAAIIVEVSPVRDETIARDTLVLIRELCTRNGCKFILDDIVTGFRYSPTGVLGYYNPISLQPTILADFVCLGKSLSTFGKVSALLGPADIMDALADKVFMSYTYSDHPLGILDAIETLRTYDELGNRLFLHIHGVGTTLKNGLNKVFRQRGFEAEVYGHPSRTTIESQMKPEVYWEFLSRLVDEHDVLIHRPQFAVMPHTPEDVIRSIDAVSKTLAGMGFELQ